MSPRTVTTGLIVGALVAEWLRFDLHAAGYSWLIMVICVAGAVVAWIRQARRVPAVQLPPVVEDLGDRTELTPGEERQFADALREWHRGQQDAAFREIAHGSPAPLIAARGALYFLWLSFAILAVVPAGAVPATFVPALPRFVIVALGTALIALTAGVPLGVRDWKRARKAVGK
jgi:hypothetical protein